MKYSILILLIICHCRFYGQSPGTVHIYDIPSTGILLDNGWKFHTGDNMDWSKPELNDSGWQSINPTLDIHDSLPQIPKTGIVWFRLHLDIDSSVSDQLMLVIQQSGASEIFLNGKMIHRFGKIHTDPDVVRAFNPLDKPVAFPVGKSSAQLLAVRFALQPGIRYSSHWSAENRGLYIVVNKNENAIYQYQHTHIRADEGDFLKIGFFGILCILYFAFYLFYPSQKAHLYFSLFALQEAVVRYLIIYFHKLNDVGDWSLLNNSIVFLQVAGYMILLMAIYRLFDHKKGWIFYSIFALGMISIPMGAYVYRWGWLMYGLVFTNFINIDIARMSFISIRNNKKGAWIIASGAVMFIIFWLLFTVSGDRHIYIMDYFTLARFSVPIAVAFYLGYDFALTNHSLQQKLAEVKNLSEEKQQILSAQNETLEKQVVKRTAELSQSLVELKATQAHLIQSEKMASLGELTAGIAHEIQNPLNFVNNFAEVNKELLAEMKDQMSQGRMDEAKIIANDIMDNEEKIYHHGKRAESIVKGMLQHSQSSSGTKELTDINGLTDEYLRLSFHGLRAKDKNFNAAIQTDFDQNTGKINIIPQDIGRALLNLYNNAFYAVNERKKADNGLPTLERLATRYEPAVSVRTKKTGTGIEIRVRDNGNGIPQNIVDKIFQPFFTTKPAGQGTGLGLSLSYDIIKAHQGTIRVETRQEEESSYTEFIIQLPS